MKVRGSGLFFGILFSICAISYCGISLGADKLPAAADLFPLNDLPCPETDREKAYLGIQGQGRFRITDIPAKVVIIEIFSMYCPFCQKEAPIVNELFDLIRKDPLLDRDIKLIGIGAGNSAFEVDIFRDKYSILFPLLADADFALHNALGKVRTPYFIILTKNEKGTMKVVYSAVGSIGNPGDFLQGVLKMGGLNKGA